MLAELNEDGTRIACRTAYADKDLIRQVPGATWDAQSRLWHAPLSWGSCKILRGVFNTKLEIGPRLTQWAWHEKTTRVDPCLMLREQLTLTDDLVVDPSIRAVIEKHRDDPMKLYPHQEVDVAFLLTARLALLTNEMGTGKTPAVIAALRALIDLGEWPFPACFIVPNSMKRPWANEFRAWLPEAEVHLITGSAAKRHKILEDIALAAADHQPVVGVLNWEAARLHSRLAPYGSVRLKDEEKIPKELNAIPWVTVVGDEVHKMKDPKSKQTRATWSVGHGSSVHWRWGLTGTPLANAVDDMWSLLHFVDPLEWPSKTKMIDRFALMTWNSFGAMEVLGVRPDTRDEFYSIVDPRMRRVTKELVLPFLPKKIREVRYTDMSAKQAKAYRQIEEGMVTKLEDGSLVVTTNSLSRNTRLLQFSSSYAEVVDEEGSVRLTEPSNKIDELMHLLDDLGDEPVVVAAMSRQLIEMTARRLDAAAQEWAKTHRGQVNPYSYRLYTGLGNGLTDDIREKNREDFQNGLVRCLLMTISAGGVGITLTRAGVMCFLQRSWSLVENKQAEDRVHRIGSESHDKVVIVDFITPGTVEELQITRLHVKAARLEEVVRDRDALRRQASHDEESAARLAALEEEAARIEQEPLWVA